MIKKELNPYFTLLFAVFSALLVYGYSLSNFTLMVDSESPVYPTFSLEHGRWGTNLIRYHLFEGHLPYYTQLLGLIFLSLSAVVMAEILRFRGIWKISFILLFISFPQHAYQMAFTMQADAIGIGYFTGALAVWIWFSKIEFRRLRDLLTLRNIGFLVAIVLLLTFTVAIYQGLIFVPILLFAARFFQDLFSDEFHFADKIKTSLIFVGLLLFSVFLYWVSLKVFFPQIRNEYITSYASGSEDNHLVNFLQLWADNLSGKFYYGSQIFVFATVCGILTLIYSLLKPKFILLKIAVLIFLFLAPFVLSYFIHNNNHPPRIYIGSTIIFGFIPVFIFSRILKEKFMLWAALGIFLVNTFFVTDLFAAAHRIYLKDLALATQINSEIKGLLPNYSPQSNYVYFHGAPSESEIQPLKIPASDVFEGSIFRWDKGSNWRMLNFLSYHDLGNYKIVKESKIFDEFKDSIAAMPLWPAQGSVKLFNDAVVVKFREKAGAPLPFQAAEMAEIPKLSKLNILPEKNENIIGNFDEYEEGDKLLKIVGWAAKKGLSTERSSAKLIIYNDKGIYDLTTVIYPRPDITKFINDGINYDASGFTAELNKSELPKGTYQLGFGITDLNDQKSVYKPFNRSITVK